MKKHVYKPGDKVRVLRDRFIERVGYPLIYGMFMEEVENDPRVAEALKALEYPTGGLPGGKINIPHYFQIAVAKMRVEQKGFGGNERKIIYEPEGGFARQPGQVLTVYSKRVAKTGVRFPSRSWYDSYGGGYDYEQGGLDDCKTHVLLMTDSGEIEACDVEFVRRA